MGRETIKAKADVPNKDSIRLFRFGQRVGTVGDSQVYLESELFINLHFKNSVELVFFKTLKYT